MKKLLFAILFLFLPALALAAPDITHISTHYTHDSICFKILISRQKGDFDPLKEGGWAFQLFLDTDQNDATGYSGHGFDFNVRGIEQLSNGDIHIRKAQHSIGPGGWGLSTGQARLAFKKNYFSIDIPLSSINTGRRHLDYRLELYETVAAPKHKGVSHQYVKHYDGSSAPAR